MGPVDSVPIHEQVPDGSTDRRREIVEEMVRVVELNAVLIRCHHIPVVSIDSHDRLLTQEICRVITDKTTPPQCFQNKAFIYLLSKTKSS